MSFVSSTTPSYSRHGAPSVPKKMNTQIEALRNRYKQSNKGNAKLSPLGGGGGEASPPAVPPTATPNNKVTVEYTTTTTTTTESLLKYELDQSLEKEKKSQSKESKEKNKVSLQTPFTTLLLLLVILLFYLNYLTIFKLQTNTFRTIIYTVTVAKECNSLLREMVKRRVMKRA